MPNTTSQDGSKFEFLQDMAMTLPLGGDAKTKAGPYGAKLCVVTMKVD
jgi:hypothetical protein